MTESSWLRQFILNSFHFTLNFFDLLVQSKPFRLPVQPHQSSLSSSNWDSHLRVVQLYRLRWWIGRKLPSSFVFTCELPSLCANDFLFCFFFFGFFKATRSLAQQWASLQQCKPMPTIVFLFYSLDFFRFSYSGDILILCFKFLAAP